MSVFQVDDLTARLDAAVQLGSSTAIATRVKAELESLIGHDGLRLPDRFYATRSDSYARRLLYRDPQSRYTAVVMTWGPNQGTPLHDHSGIWCVEGVVEGKLEVKQYHLESEVGEVFRFREMGRVLAGVGSAGSLIPPFEYHTLGNALSDGSSLTLHIYGGEMTNCHVFVPRADGTYERCDRRLVYDDQP